MRESDADDQRGRGPSRPWEDHWLIAVLLALGLLWMGILLAEVPGQPENRRLGNEIASPSAATATSKTPHDIHRAAEAAQPSDARPFPI